MKKGVIFVKQSQFKTQIMKKINARSTDSTISTGVVAQNDLKKIGYISLQFYVSESLIGVDVAGFSSIHTYSCKANSKKDFSRNKYFVERFINKCDNPSFLKSQLGIN